MRYASLIGLLCAGLLLNVSADAQSPGGGIRIGILNDQSGPYADFGGKTSVDAARMAVDDVGGKVLGKSILSDIHALGLATANGLIFTTAFYWDRDEASRV